MVEVVVLLLLPLGQVEALKLVVELP